MGRIAEKYSTEQKAELIRLVIHCNQSIKNACSLLAQGSADLDPFVMEYDSARKYVSLHKQAMREAAPQDRDKAVTKLLEELWTAVSKQAAKNIEAIEEGKKVTAQEMATTLANVRSFAKDVEKAKAPVKHRDDAVVSLSKMLEARTAAAKGGNASQAA